jgi:LPXTG-motif cell wall-anchored protein
VGTKPSTPAQTPDNSESPMKLWYILAPAAVLILLLLLLLRKRKKKDGN